MSRRRGFLAALLMATGLAHAAGETPAPAPAPTPSSRSWLGVWLEDAVDGGVQIIEVVPNGPAAKAGLASGDLVIRIGKKDVADRNELSHALEGLPPGTPVAVTILRKGESKETQLVLGTPRPPGVITPVPPVAPVPREPASAALVLGIGVGEIPEELRKHLGGPANAGLLVVRVTPDGISGKALKAGDLLVSVGGTAVATEADLDRAVLSRSSGPVELAGRRAKEPFTSEIALRLKSPEQRAREARKRAIEDSIRQLERRLSELKRQLDDLSDVP